MIKKSSFLLLTLFLVIITCKDNSVGLDPIGLRGEVTGNWEPLTLNDTIEVYVNFENNVHLGDPFTDVTLIPEASASTFQVWTDSFYARDSSNVYFPIEVECEVIEEVYTCYSTEYIVEDAKPAGFRYLGNGFATDGSELYLNGIIVEGNNGEGF